MAHDVTIGIIPVFVSHMGCPNECTFCNQRKINGVVDAILPNDLDAYIQMYLKTMKRDQVELAFFGGSFTGIDVQRQMEYLSIAHVYKKSGLIDKIRISTRPDYIDHVIIDRLKTYEVDTVELGCQSYSDAVLKKTKRGHTSDDIYRAVRLLKDAKIQVGIQLMLGLPGDDEMTFKHSVAETLKLDPFCVRLYPVLVVKETELEQWYLSGKYEPIPLNDAVRLTAYALKQFEQAGISVIRMGLQRTELIDVGASVVAGPFHAAFGELVWSHLYLEAVTQRIMMHSEQIVNLEREHKIFDLRFFVHPKRLSIMKGQNKSNVTHLMTCLDGLTQNGVNVQIRVVTDETLSLNEVRMENDVFSEQFSII